MQDAGRDRDVSDCDLRGWILYLDLRIRQDEDVAGQAGA